MKDPTRDSSLLLNARVAGLLYLALAFFGAFGILYVRSALVVPGDAAATAGNILRSETLFRIGFVSDLIGQTIFIFLVLALYRLLKPVDRAQALLMVILALVAVPIAMLNLVNQAAALVLVGGADYLAVFDPAQRAALALLFLELQGHGVSIAQIFWGLWLFPLGYLVFRSGFLPRLLGLLLMIGCFGYLVDFFTGSLLPDSGMTVSQFTFIGELLLPLWLLIKGVNVERWKKLALGPAG
jgi:hypothetical protein